ncbi:methylated-DNA--[protein]-cysteine S-methyltransferase [Demequina lutea]|uniref:methylated-DNA--[protein]-cysteine S-methyltransferase n=1 Tax=Demequina lutea TaxID=431489 RepID=A0A7Z0CGW7_9MICO|nr:methylated-DNA--[protein]-cysteine S-methyltransferase [Demequina lutea]NYI40184.1 methylated-DNA-[protein]-cysteine S-methyltransferase [Demequina lutea]
MQEPLLHASYGTPFGVLHVLASADGTVRASGFRGVGDIAAQLAPPWQGCGWIDAALPAVDSAVKRWLAGDGDALASVPVAQAGGPFFQKVWETLRHLPAGEPLSYKELAEAAGSPRAMRAVGTACSHNAVAPFVPCHRVVSAGGKLGSYGYGGTAIKAAMLALEAGGDSAAIERAAVAAHPGSLAPAQALPPTQAMQGVR